MDVLLEKEFNWVAKVYVCSYVQLCVESARIKPAITLTTMVPLLGRKVKFSELSDRAGQGTGDLVPAKKLTLNRKLS